MAAAFIILGLLGCREDEISRYQVPRQETVNQRIRFLGVIVPHEDRTWFFKLVGSARVVEEHRQEFEQFLGTVRFTDKPDSPLTWKAPEGWQEEGKSKLRLATFRIGPKGMGAELSVTPLGREAGSVLDNVNRWRGQLGLHPIREEQLGQLTKALKVAGENAVLVDMSADPGKSVAARPKPGGEAPLSYQLPQGWQEQPVKPGSMRVAGFLISEGDRTAEVTVIAAGGTLRDNINRWREQIQLGPVSDQELNKQLRKIEVGGVAASYVELMGPESAGAKRESILGVVVARGEQSWFIKMKGPAELVARQKSKFEEFIRSVRFEKGANHG